MIGAGQTQYEDPGGLHLQPGQAADIWTRHGPAELPGPEELLLCLGVVMSCWAVSRDASDSMLSSSHETFLEYLTQ